MSYMTKRYKNSSECENWETISKILACQLSIDVHNRKGFLALTTTTVSKKQEKDFIAYPLLKKIDQVGDALWSKVCAPAFFLYYIKAN